jgi:hypothetical protein
MTVRKNDALVNRQFDMTFNLAAALHMLDGGTSEFRDAVQPSNGNAAAPGNIVASVTHAPDASAAGTSRGVSLIGTMEDTSADADGTIRMVRFKDPTGVFTFDCSAGQQGPAIGITAAALVGGVAQFTAPAHGFANGDQVEISGHSVAAYNTKWDVFNVTANTFQVFSTLAPGASGTARKTFDVVVDNATLVAGQDFKVLSMAFNEPI